MARGAGRGAGLADVVVRPADLDTAARAMATERSAARAAARARLDAATARAVHDLEAATARFDQVRSDQRALLDGAEWALTAHDTLPACAAAIEAAEAVFQARRLEQRTARTSLDRVLEQRSAAALAMQEADSQVGDLDSFGMDENGLRRELEAAGAAARAAHEAHATAVATVQHLVGALDGADRSRTELGARLAALDPAVDRASDDVGRVRAALDAWHRASTGASVDNYSQALADAFGDLLADLAQEEAITGQAPDEGTMLRAREELDRAAAALRRVEAAAVPTLSPADRAAIEAAHAACDAAADRVDRKIGRAAAQRRLEEARQAERELLQRLGLDSYLQVVLTGGRTTAVNPDRRAAESRYLSARSTLDSLNVALQGSPELDHLHSERCRLLAHVTDRLGVDPGDQVVALLRAHPMLPGSIVDDLREALNAAGVHPVGVSLAEAAEGWLNEQTAAHEARRQAAAERSELERTLVDLAAEATSLREQLSVARAAEARAVEQLELATRSVGAVEAELTDRVGEDTTRYQRFVAAQQLRTQIEALSATLAHAEHDARGCYDAATAAVDAAELSLDRAHGALTDIARRARSLAEDLPPDQRPVGDRLATLPELAQVLRARAGALDPSIDDAEGHVAQANAKVDASFAAADAAGTGLDGPRPEDVHDGFERLLASHADVRIVLDEPFIDVDPVLRSRLLEVVLAHLETGPVVLLTDDPDVLGWAIGLPSHQGAVVSTDSVLNLCGASADTMGAAPDLTEGPSVRLPVGQR